jgi:hypothetical protein
VSQLNGVQVLQQLVVEQGEAVADAKVAFGNAQGELLWRGPGEQVIGRLRGSGPHGDREFRAADFLPAEQVADGLDGL